MLNKSSVKSIVKPAALSAVLVAVSSCGHRNNKVLPEKDFDAVCDTAYVVGTYPYSSVDAEGIRILVADSQGNTMRAKHEPEKINTEDMNILCSQPGDTILVQRKASKDMCTVVRNLTRENMARQYQR